MAGPYRAASRKIPAPREMFIGMGLGLTAGMIWRAWHASYKAAVDDYYKKYQAELAAKTNN